MDLRSPTFDPRTRSAVATALAVWRHRLFRFAFGDRVGVAVFLGALAFFGLYWRIGFFINDNLAIANSLVAVADGHLDVDRIVFGPDPQYQPGMNVVGDRLYGRNYGHVFYALPFLWLLELVALVADPRIAIAGAWSLVLVALGVTVGRLAGQERAFATLGSVAGLALFAANVALAAPLDPLWHPVVALQLATMVAAAFVGVVLYRLLALVHDRRVGAFVGLVAVLATPVGFWASVPKRHALTALLAVVALYAFARSRHATGDGAALRFRMASYVAVGLTTWVHAAEAFILFAVLVPLDLLTARSNDPRRLTAVALAFGVSLLPFLSTNALISGNPLRPPRMLTRYDGQVSVLLEGSSAGVDAGVEDASAGGESGDSSSGGGWFSLLAAAASGAEAGTDRFVLQLDRGLAIVTDSPDRLYHTFVRSGWIPAQAKDRQAVNLTVLESTPLLGALVALPVLAGRYASGRLRTTTFDVGAVVPESPRRQTDAFVALYTIAFVVFYLPQLPLHAQVTVRYLLPIVPMLCYAVGRLPSIRRVVQEAGSELAWSYAGFVLLGGQLGVVALAFLQLSTGEGLQLFALAGLAAGGLTGIWVLADQLVDGLDARVGAAVVALTGAVSTSFLLLTGWVYLRYGDFALGLARLASEALSAL